MMLIGFGSLSGAGLLAVVLRGTAFFAAFVREALFRATVLAGHVFLADALDAVAFVVDATAGGATGGEDTTAGVGVEGGATTGGAFGVATDPADTDDVFADCPVPFVAPNSPAMNGLAMHS